MHHQYPGRAFPPPPACWALRRGELTLLSAGLFDLGRLAVAHKSVVRFKLLHGLVGVIHQRKSGALAATILCSKAKARDLILGGFVERAEFLAQLVFADICAAGMEDIAADTVSLCGCFKSSGGNVGEAWRVRGAVRQERHIHDHLLPAEEGIADELARAQGHLALRHDCWVDWKGAALGSMRERLSARLLCRRVWWWKFKRSWVGWSRTKSWLWRIIHA